MGRLLILAPLLALFICQSAAPALAAEAERDLPAPKPITRVAPEFPADALSAEVSGRVLLSLTIDEKGNVTNTAVVAEIPPGYGFGAAARSAVLQWKFEPGLPGEYRITVNFGMPGNLLAQAKTELGPAPTERDMPAYPESARRDGITGSATVRLNFGPDGLVKNAELISEWPAGAGFGPAAAKAGKSFKFEPRPGGASYVLRVHFLPGGEVLQSAPRYAPLVPMADLDAAGAARVTGEAGLKITSGKRGFVVGAEVLWETPAGYGFGAAAKNYLMTSALPEQTPDGFYFVRVKFRETWLIPADALTADPSQAPSCGDGRPRTAENPIALLRLKVAGNGRVESTSLVFSDPRGGAATAEAYAIAKTLKFESSDSGGYYFFCSE